MDKVIALLKHNEDGDEEISVDPKITTISNSWSSPEFQNYFIDHGVTHINVRIDVGAEMPNGIHDVLSFLMWLREQEGEV